MDSFDETYLHTGYEPNAYDFKETSVEPCTELLDSPPFFSDKGFPADAEYDDAALEGMLREAYRVHRHHSQREDLSVSLSSSSVSDRTRRPVGDRAGDRAGRLAEQSSQEAQIRTVLDKQKEQILAKCQAEINRHEFQAAKEVDFPSCEKVVKMIVKDLDNLGHNRVVFRCDIEPNILALLRAVKLAWTGDVVQETSAEGDPQPNGAAESSVHVVEGLVRSIKLAVESASGVEMPADHDLLTWLVPYAASMHRRFAVGRDGKTAYERNVGRRAVRPLGTVRWASVVDAFAAIQPPSGSSGITV